MQFSSELSHVQTMLYSGCVLSVLLHEFLMFPSESTCESISEMSVVKTHQNFATFDCDETKFKKQFGIRARNSWMIIQNAPYHLVLRNKQFPDISLFPRVRFFYGWSTDPDQDQRSETNRIIVHQMNPFQEWIHGLLDTSWSEWFRITDPNPYHPKGKHPSNTP